MTAIRYARVAAVCACVLGVAACETPPLEAPAPSRTVSTPRYNLSGYSAAFKEGYADACAKPSRRDTERMKNDSDYAIGWNDGQSLCRAR